MSEIERPRRVTFGTKGRPIKILANTFNVSFDDRLTITQYDVAIKPSAAFAAVNRRIFSAWVEECLQSSDRTLKDLAPLCVYDGQKNLFAPKPLGITHQGKTFPVTWKAEGRDRDQHFQITIKEVAKLDLAHLMHYLGDNYPTNIPISRIEYPRDKIGALEVLLRHGAQLSGRLITFGRGCGSFFSEEGKREIRNGVSVYFGWSQSIRPAIGPLRSQLSQGRINSQKQLLINVDVAASAFYQYGPVTQVVAKFLNAPNIEACRDRFPRDQERVQKFLRRLNIEINYRATGRKRYRIETLSRESAAEIMLEPREGEGQEKFSVVQFFKERYGIGLRYPWLPCIVVGGGKGGVKIPMELCNIRPNQRHLGKLNEMQVADMIKFTAIPPSNRRDNIQRGITALHGNNDRDFLSSWGVQIGNEMTTVNARVLPPPNLTFHPQSQGGHTIASKDGTWRFGQGRAFAVPAELKSWAVAVFGSPNAVRGPDIEKFLRGLVGVLKEMGMNVNTSRPPMDLVVYQGRNEHPGNALQNAAQRSQELLPSEKGRPDLIFCILIGKSPVYADIKCAAETGLDLMTQCVVDKHVRDDPSRKRAYYANLALKINAKLGGVNVFMNPSQELPPVGPSRVPTMIVGADVTHPPPGIQGASIAAVVGSMDPRYADYRAVVNVQESRQEIIRTFPSMISHLFKIFGERNKVLPKRLVIYRDGVSEGQFAEVLESEFMALKKKLVQEFGNEAVPTVTFVVVGKRHHMRFFAKDQRDTDRSGNLQAGTVIDQDIVHPYESDFFLYSHPGLQGTSRPSHYHLLYDENGFNPDSLQELTYRLCYLYCRSTRAVNVVTPAYYADLLAERARCFGDEQLTEEIERRMFFV